MYMKDTTNKTTLQKENKNREIEIRAILEEVQAMTILKQLEDGEGDYLGEEIITDLYFCKNEVKELSEVEMNEVGSYSLRLREKEKNGVKNTDLNIKVITNYRDHGVLDEHETAIGSLEETYMILKTIGLKPFFRLKKKRKSFYIKAQNMTVNLEYIDGFGIAIEIEIITSQENADSAKQIIQSYLSKVGVMEEQIVPQSITKIIMSNMSKFDGTVTL